DVNCVFVYRTIRELAKAVDQGTVSNMPKLLTLREGDKSRPLIVFAGGVNCFLEIKSVLEGLDFDGVVYGIRLSDFDCPVTDPASVSDEIEACSQELARQGIVAPVSLVGYSLGGIFALELARKIQQSGQKIRFLGLVDPLHSEHTWPWNIWAGYVFQLLLRRLWRLPREILKGLKPGISASEAAQAADPPRRHPLLQELQPFIFRYCNPTWESYPELAPEWLGGYTPEYEREMRKLLRMRGLYRPSVYHGKLVFYRAEGGTPIFRAQRQIWSCYLPNAEWVDWRGTHLSIVVGRNGVRLGNDIGRRLRALEKRTEQVA
ncbi:thioesterase domain-containing protein, partial [Roseibium sp.]|uniref:thioesterase domain-containing protein n=1 Tax=Roseibium sp. TaxID=1936156 RepID=UPI003D149DA3